MAINTKNIAGKYLTFLLGDACYGVEIMKIKEIIGMIPVTSIPEAPSYVKGVINLRGRVIPVIDLRTKFALTYQTSTDRTCIVVSEVDKGDGIVPVGFVVDFVSEVINIKADDIDAAPSFGTTADAENISGIAKQGRKIVILLDIEKVLAENDSTVFRNAA